MLWKVRTKWVDYKEWNWDALVNFPLAIHITFGLKLTIEQRSGGARLVRAGVLLQFAPILIAISGTDGFTT